jgi:hypothetical protein
MKRRISSSIDPSVFKGNICKEKTEIEKIIKILTILKQYGNPKNPININHDLMVFNGFNVRKITEKDCTKLRNLDVIIHTEADEMCRWLID